MKSAQTLFGQRPRRGDRNRPEQQADPNGAASRRPVSATEANAPSRPPAPRAAVEEADPAPTGMEQTEGDDDDQDVESAPHQGLGCEEPDEEPRSRILRDDAKAFEQLFGRLPRPNRHQRPFHPDEADQDRRGGVDACRPGEHDPGVGRRDDEARQQWSGERSQALRRQRRGVRRDQLGRRRCEGGQKRRHGRAQQRRHDREQPREGVDGHLGRTGEERDGGTSHGDCGARARSTAGRARAESGRKGPQQMVLRARPEPCARPRRSRRRSLRGRRTRRPRARRGSPIRRQPMCRRRSAGAAATGFAGPSRTPRPHPRAAESPHAPAQHLACLHQARLRAVKPSSHEATALVTVSSSGPPVRRPGYRVSALPSQRITESAQALLR